MKKSKRMTIREKRNKRLLTLATVGEAFYMGYMKGVSWRLSSEV